jgi:predicted secreted protein
VDVYAAIRRLRLWLVFRPLEGLFGTYLRQEHTAGIMVNVRVHPALQRYTAAHELGHHLMGHDAGLDPESNINRWSKLGTQEMAAQMFAAEFLMPLAAVNAAAAALGIRPTGVHEMDVYQLSLRLRTSYAAMITRLHTLDWFGSAQAEQLRSIPPKALKRELLGRPLDDPQGDVWLVSDRHPDTAITPLVGDEVVFSLEEAPSTGYRWAPELDDGLTVDGDDFIEPTSADDEGRLGGPGHRRLYVSVTEPLTAHARFQLRMLWDAEEPPAAALDVSVDADVRPQPGIDVAQQPALLAV